MARSLSRARLFLCPLVGAPLLLSLPGRPGRSLQWLAGTASRNAEKGSRELRESLRQGAVRRRYASCTNAGQLLLLYAFMHAVSKGTALTRAPWPRLVVGPASAFSCFNSEAKDQRLSLPATALDERASPPAPYPAWY